MTQTRTSPHAPPAGAATTTALLVGVTLVLVGLGLIGLAALGPLGFLVPLPAIGLLFLYRAVVRSTHSPQTRAAAREVGAIGLALALGFGAWVGAVMLGLVLEVVPFLSEGSYPYESLWMAGSVVVAVVSVPVWWWLLRRWADPANASRLRTAATY